MLRHLALLAAVFAVCTGLAEAFGAANLGTAAFFGQLGFVITLTALLSRPSR